MFRFLPSYHNLILSLLCGRYGLGDMEKYRCEELAATLQWPCFALDVYGTGVRASNDAEAAALMAAATADPATFHANIQVTCQNRTLLSTARR